MEASTLEDYRLRIIVVSHHQSNNGIVQFQQIIVSFDINLNFAKDNDDMPSIFSLRVLFALLPHSTDSNWRNTIPSQENQIGVKIVCLITRPIVKFIFP